MCRIYTLLFLAMLFCLRGYGQIGVIADKAYAHDTLRTNSISVGYSFLFYISDDEMNAHTNYRFLNSGHFDYVFKTTDIDLSLRQTIERESDGGWSSNNLVYLSSGISKYKPIAEDKAVLRKLYPEPIAIFQNNTDRGLHRRFQFGGLLHPWSYFHPKFNINIGVGVVYDWSSWEVNNQNEIDDASPELKEKIQYINSRIKLKDNMYQVHNEWRPMLMLSINYRVINEVSFNLNTSFQQSLVSPYSKEIQKVYPDLGKVYPYVLTQLDANIKLYKNFFMSLSMSLDYENNNLSLYKSSWAYSMLVGVSWKFSNQRVL